MTSRNKRKCLYCKEEFQVDVRNAKKQKCCRRTACRKAQKAARDARWRAKNPDYFKGPLHVRRVQTWRAENPGYWRRQRSGRGEARRQRTAEPVGDALQDALALEAIDTAGESATLASTKASKALQDALSVSLAGQSAILIGLIAHLTDSTLQADIALTTRRLIQLGLDILSGGTHPNAPEESAAP